jgi:antitoxin component YwqK of YwqJK toxin-antitoxin module
MQAWIVVLQNPYFVKTDSSGNYEIKNIPDGTYTLKVWYPFRKTISERIKIKNSAIIRKDFTI